MKIDSDPLQVRNTIYVELVAINMVKITKDFDMAKFEDSENHIEVVYPKASEGLVEFFRKCKVEYSEVMMCPRCNVIFDKKVAKKVEFSQQAKKQENWRKNRPQFYFDKRGIPHNKEHVIAQ